MIIIIASGLYLLFKLFYREWKQSEIDLKIEDEKINEDSVKKIEKNYDPEKVKKNKSIIDYFKNN
jgi:hypothetical protein